MAKHVIHGVVFTPQRLALTTMERGKEAWQQVGQDDILLEPPRPASKEGATDGESPQECLIRQLRALAPRLPGECNIALPAERLLLRVVDLPSTEPDELLGMIELQIEKISPFPVDRLTISYEKLAETETSSRVLIVGVQNSEIDALGELIHGAGLTPRWIDVDVMGWWHWLTHRERVAKYGREIILLDVSGGLKLIVAQSGVPLVIRTLPGAEELSEAEAHEMVVEEIDFTLTSLETEWGGVDHTQYTVWYEDHEPTSLAAAVAGAVQADVQVHSLGEFPPLSEALAERAVLRNPERVDLAPPEWEALDTARATKKQIIQATAVLLGIWLLLLGAFSIALAVRKAGLTKVQQRREAMAEPVAEVRETRDKVMFLRKYTDRTFSSLEVLRAISIALPEDVDLSSFTYNKSGSVTVRGEAGREDPIYKFVEKLQDNEIFSEVKLDRVEKKSRQGEIRSIFRLTAKMQGETV